MAFGIEFAPFLIPFRRRLQTFAVFYYVTNFLLSGLFGLSITLSFFLTRYYYIPFLYLCWWIFDHETPLRGMCIMFSKINLKK